MSGQVDMAWLDVARQAGRQDRDMEVHELRAEIARLRSLVKDLADDLEAELNGRYPQNIRDYPSMDARYERDMANVYAARAALEPKP